MNYFQLNNGLKIPVIGAGTYPYKEELEESIPVMMDIGFRLFDTSDNYDNEQFVGNALGRLSKESLESLLIVTKYSNPFKSVKEAFEESAEKIFSKTALPDRKPDIYLLHWPYPFLWKKRWKEMEQLCIDGKCKGIGICNFTNNYLKKLLSICKVKPVINQFECHPMFQQNDTIKLCNKNDIQVMCYSPLARMNKVLFDNEILNQIASNKEKSVGQIILNWNISEGRIPIPASNNQEHIKENFESISFDLSKDELEKIDSLEKGMRIRFAPEKRFTKKQKLFFFIFFCKTVLGIRK